MWWEAIQKLFVLCLLGVIALVGCRTPEEETATEVVATVLATESPASATVPATLVPTSATQATAVPSLTFTPAPPTPTDTPAPTATPTPQPVTSISLLPVAEGFTQPLYLTHAFDERLFVVEQPGMVWIVVNGVVQATPFLDLRDRVAADAYERGLLGLAFHPNYAENGSFYVNYTDRSGDTVIARYQVSPEDPNLANPDSEFIVLAVEQPYPNHNGGQLQFGPDGFLYLGLGDGGSGGDPQGNGQDGSTLLGAVLRLDVDGPEPYGIPADNPFIGDNDPRADESWAYGLRNPWRFSFDRLTGDLYLADVGQNLWEEVNFQPAGAPGGRNYGWNVMEGSHCYVNESCDMVGLTQPVAEYGHQDGNCSVTGGYVYRGQLFPALGGTYFFADYCSGLIWSLFRTSEDVWQQTLVAQSGMFISSFGEDASGELYVLDHVGGAVYQVQP